MADAPPGPGTINLQASDALKSVDFPQRAKRLFSAETYSDFVRESLRLLAERPQTALLYDSTIDEPVAALMDTMRAAFSLSVSPRYVSVFADGNPYAVQALSQRFDVSPRQILTTTGATSGLTQLLKALLVRGDRVLVENPGFDLLIQTARDVGAVVETFERPAPSFAVDLEDLERKLATGPKAVILTNLHNPSGVLTSEAALRRIATAAARVGAYVIVDEVYAEFATEGAPPCAARLAENLISVSSLSKVFGLFALKFGWIIGSDTVIDRVRTAMPEGDLGVSKLAHAVAAHVLEEREVYELHWKRILASTRPVAERHVARMKAEGLLDGEIPPHGNMAFLRTPGFDDSLALARALLLDHDLLVAPGEYFGRPGFIRLGFGSEPAELDRRLARLHQGLKSLVR